MLQINPYLQPGTWAEVENPERIVVVTEVANHVYNQQNQLHDFKINVGALVIYRPLSVVRDAHEYYATPIEVFNQKFVKV